MKSPEPSPVGDSRPRLQKCAKISVGIEGHTDSRGNKRKNKRLSQARANAVRDYLIEQGIDADRLVAKGFGPARPVASNKSKRGRDQNRRVEFVIVDQKPIGVDVSEQAAEDDIQMEFNLGDDEDAGEPPADDDIQMEFNLGDDEGAGEPPPEEPPADDGAGDEGDIEFNF